MKTLKLSIILPFVLATALLFVMNLALAAAQGPPPPSSFWGTVKVNGENVAEGIIITAWINGTEEARTSAQIWQEDTIHVINVPNGTEGDTITFQVDGVTANQTATWQSGTNVELNLTVGSGPPVADFTCTPTSGQPPLTITCTDASTGDITSRSWELGDGTTISDQSSITHTYTLTGTYTVGLTVTGPDGSDSESKVNYISVSSSQSGSIALQLAPNHIEMYVGQKITVSQTIQEADGLYGLEVYCSTEGDFISLQNPTLGDLFDADALIGINQLISNTWHVALAQKYPAPLLSGDGVFAYSTLNAIMTGTTELACQPKASNGDGLPLPISTTPNTITVLPGIPDAIVGLATYQSRLPWHGIEVSAIGPTNKRFTTTETGRFELLELSAGSYEVKAETPGYLYSCQDSEVIAGKPTTLDPTKLLAGDVNGDDVIDILDAIAVGDVFGQAPAEHPTDFNADGIVDIFDLTPLGRNFSKSREGCEGW